SQVCVSRAKQSMESRPVKQACQLYKQHLSTAERPRVEPSWKGTLRRESLVRWNHEAEARVSHPSGCVLPPAFGHRLLHHPPPHDRGPLAGADRFQGRLLAKLWFPLLPGSPPDAGLQEPCCSQPYPLTASSPARLSVPRSDVWWRPCRFRLVPRRSRLQRPDLQSLRYHPCIRPAPDPPPRPKIGRASCRATECATEWW